MAQLPAGALLQFCSCTHALHCACSFTGESMDPEQTLLYAYYADGKAEPTFLYPKFALKEEKC